MHKRYFPIAILTGLLFIVALAGYLLPATSAELPVRTLHENKGGKVIFNHAAHSETSDQNCGLCHHYTGNDKNPPKCSTCHVKKYDEAFKKNHQDDFDKKLCKSCHHAESTIALFKHEDHIEDYAPDDCQACHHDESIEPEAQACDDCHAGPGDETMPSLEKASHAKCMSCHKDFFDEGSEGCKKCHARNPRKQEINKPRACSTCHEKPVEELLPTTTNAFHVQCQTCHEYQGAGPYGDDACYQCHMK